MAPTPKFKPVVKDRLFYDRYEFCLAFDADEASALRGLDKDKISRLLERRREWQQIGLERWLNQGNILNSRSYREINVSAEPNLHTLADIVLNSGVEYKLVTSVNSVWLYTNDLALIDSVSRCEFIKNKKHTQAVVDRPKDSIRLQNPQHQQRSYLRSAKLTEKEKTSLRNFFNNQPDIRPSAGLQGFFNSPFHRTQDYFFMDYNETSWLTMIALIRPGLIRKTIQLIGS